MSTAKRRVKANMTLADTIDALIEPTGWLALIALIWTAADAIFGDR